MQQPAFDSRGRLLVLSDRNGYWQSWRETAEYRLAPLPCAAAEHAGAPWRLGACSYLALAGDGLLLSWFIEGSALLAERDGSDERRLAGDYSRFRQLAVDESFYYTIAATPEQGSVVLAIDRASRGILEDQLERVFLEFNQPNTGRAAERRGVGLGLAIVDRIARILGYPVKVRSQPGRGSVFSIRVPLARQLAMSPIAPLPRASVGDPLPGGAWWCWTMN